MSLVLPKCNSKLRNNGTLQDTYKISNSLCNVSLFSKKREREWAFITLLGVFSPFIVIILGNCFQNPTTLLLYYSLFWWNQRRMN